MAQRKLNQEIDKCFKQVDLGVEQFDAQYEKYEQSTNASQRDKLVDSIKKECKKLQRLRDQIKTWAAGNEVKDKGPLQEKRELIETKMEAFKAVEKEMKTKAFSKEGLLVAQKLDPKEREKEEVYSFLNEMKDELQDQVDKAESSRDQYQAQAKKSKKDTQAKEKVGELEHRIERHKWHIQQLELLMRAVENEDVEADAVKAVQDDIRNYVDSNDDPDFFEDEGIYDEFGLEEGSRFNGPQDLDRVSSQDNYSAQDEILEQQTSNDATKGKSKALPDPVPAPARRPSQHVKSPLPALATLNNLPPAAPTNASNNMKPALPPSKPPGESLKYASAAAAAAASDTAGIGIAPLPPPPSKAAQGSALAQTASVRSSATTSPAATSAQPASSNSTTDLKAPNQSTSIAERSNASQATKSPAPSQSSVNATSPAMSTAQLVQASARDQSRIIPQHSAPSFKDTAASRSEEAPTSQIESAPQNEAQHIEEQGWPSTQSNGAGPMQQESNEQEPIYHLPSSLQELVDCYQAVKESAPEPSQPEHQRMLAASYANRPDALDAEKPRHYRPQNPAFYTPPHYPQEPLPIFDDPRLYTKVDHDALFYSFYYRQGSYQQYLAAKALKAQSWRFHKRYQTWFQRHEEPKKIEEDYEQGTYRFFDYESTWMNRRKAEFNFEYKYLEDELPA